MRALVLEDGHLGLCADAPQPEPAADDALIRVSLAGICSTDLELVKGYAGGFRGVLGHEFVGVVVDAASGSGQYPVSSGQWSDSSHLVSSGTTGVAEWVGRRVVGTINLGCRRCAVCLGEGPEHCPNRTTLGIHNKDGVFADYVTLPVVNLLEVPATVADEEAVFTEPLAAALRIREQIAVRPTARTAVVGPGRLGLLVAQVLALAGTEVVVLGRRAESLALPRQLGLPTGLVDAAADNAYDLVVEATGNDAGFAHSLRLVRPRGTLVLKSTFAGRANIDLTKLVVGEITVVGSRCGPFAPALRLLEQGAVGAQIAVRPLIEAEYPLSEGLAAFEHAARPGARKVLLRPGGPR
ncbi:MAG: alcohol dehydrogenase catalytic domain-containing protein [Candidatus Promineofilum sp.]|nr:alcohol dehydrogenase catalytic domain-containing protein [Promineifilum sp.]MCW5864184.1 alcohol dehydrogenase catalytic domain-containing protein [Anaerolineae bacterium]